MGLEKNDQTDLLLSIISDIQVNINSLRSHLETHCIKTAETLAEHGIEINNLKSEKAKNEIRIVRKLDMTTKIVMIGISVLTFANFIKEWFIK
jgi:hypothetical protein